MLFVTKCGVVFELKIGHVYIILYVVDLLTSIKISNKKYRAKHIGKSLVKIHPSCSSYASITCIYMNAQFIFRNLTQYL